MALDAGCHTVADGPALAGRALRVRGAQGAVDEQQQQSDAHAQPGKEILELQVLPQFFLSRNQKKNPTIATKIPNIIMSIGPCSKASAFGAGTH